MMKFSAQHPYQWRGTYGVHRVIGVALGLHRVHWDIQNKCLSSYMWALLLGGKLLQRNSRGPEGSSLQS